MGHHNHHATDGLVNLLTRANHDLNMIQYKLEKEFQQVYPEHNQANPMKLVSRIKKVQEDLSTLKEQCRELLAAKQDLIDKARTTLVGNRSLVQKMQASLDIPVTSESEDPAFASFKEIIDEWTVQMRTRAGDENQDSDSEDINKLLFSAIVESN
ncbi:uncharacterized protein LOC123195096 isoform X1 [Mangifera indica]|uniref:uncharacterized protein LOC123195096 isoform X1 n=1 Tax=Mangifera indica TaxID=29780 RepID=UPI001CFA3194|nr:uncharacterized protein LOC123195096 isoform X1 [Mangifera indica]XP_044464636.1 uncharacterized protein LOC123195096 isoform X1 [Mangifera indica]